MTILGKEPAYFSFCQKSRDFHLCLGKPTIEHSEHRKRPGWCGRGKPEDFKKRKISLAFFVSFFGDEKKKVT